MAERLTLIERLEKLDGPDRGVDLEILARLEQAGEWAESDIAYALSDVEETTAPPRYTSSLDAAVGLVEKMLPGCDICLSDIHADFRQPGEARYIAEVMSQLEWKTYDGFPEPVYQITGSGKGNSRPIALLIALLRARSEGGNKP